MQSTSFFVNEEDTELSESGEGSFNSLFNCRFFTDQNRGQEIHSDDIINMGTMIYGQVDASSDMNIGLKYYLDKLTLQNDHDGLEFDVVKNGGWAKIVEAQAQFWFTWVSRWKFRSPVVKSCFSSSTYRMYQTLWRFKVIQWCLLRSQPTSSFDLSASPITKINTTSRWHARSSYV